MKTNQNIFSSAFHYSDSFWAQIGRYFSLVIHSPVITLTYLAFVIVFAVAITLLRRLLILKRIFNQKTILLEITPPAFTDKGALTTQNFFSVIHGLKPEVNLKNILLGNKTVFSLEIVSTLTQGIRFLIRTTPDEADRYPLN